jgi:hypothetical protein
MPIIKDINEYVYVITSINGAIDKIYKGLDIAINDVIKSKRAPIETRSNQKHIQQELRKFGKYYISLGQSEIYIHKVRVHDKSTFNYNIL